MENKGNDTAEEAAELKKIQELARMSYFTKLFIGAQNKLTFPGLEEKGYIVEQDGTKVYLYMGSFKIQVLEKKDVPDLKERRDCKTVLHILPPEKENCAFVLYQCITWDDLLQLVEPLVEFLADVDGAPGPIYVQVDEREEQAGVEVIEVKEHLILVFEGIESLRDHSKSKNGTRQFSTAAGSEYRASDKRPSKRGRFASIHRSSRSGRNKRGR